jgi:RimJ/RimL family protein N-acetyltransferase
MAAVVETERLRLRAWRDADVEPFHAMCNDPEVMAYLGPPLTRADVEAVVVRQNGFQADHGYCFWVVERRSDGATIGFCGFRPGFEGTPLEDRIEIGWRLRRDTWGQGFAREAAQASLDWGFENVDAAREHGIWAMTVSANSRSRGLMERLGMTRHAELDFDHPALAEGDPLRPHIVYSAQSPAHG